MRLRNICNDHTRIPRRALRLALAVAVATGGCSSLHAGNPLTALPRPLPGVAAAEPELLPYPFGKDGCSQPVGAPAIAASRAGVSRQLVKLLGLARPAQGAVASQAPPPNSLITNPPVLPAVALPATPTQRPATQEVVTASATEEQETTSSMPALPVAAVATEISLSESLLDIEIPTVLAMTPAAPSASESAPAAVATEKSCPQSTHCAETTLPSADQLTGVVQACEPPTLNTAETVTSRASIELPMAGSQGAGSQETSPGTRQPDIVRSPQAMSLTVKPSANSKASHAVTLNLNDSLPESDSTPESKSRSHGSDSSRGAVLHLSSASDEVALSANLASSKLPLLPTAAAKSASVRQPSEPVSKLSDSSSGAVRPAEALPTPESDVPVSPQTRLAAAEKTLGPVKALLASRTSAAISYGAGSSTIPSSNRPADTTARASSNALAVGLQESHTLSTDYSISELSVEHPNICQLLKTSDRSVSVIGMRPGATRIALISYDSQGERTVDVREIAVGDSAATAVHLPELAKEITQTVARMYPKSDVQIVAYQDHMVVRGYTNYESDAKKILALIRKTSLAPVVDQLTTSGN